MVPSSPEGVTRNPLGSLSSQRSREVWCTSLVLNSPSLCSPRESGGAPSSHPPPPPSAPRVVGGLGRPWPNLVANDVRCQAPWETNVVFATSQGWAQGMLALLCGVETSASHCSMLQQGAAGSLLAIAASRRAPCALHTQRKVGLLQQVSQWPAPALQRKCSRKAGCGRCGTGGPIGEEPCPPCLSVRMGQEGPQRAGGGWAPQRNGAIPRTWNCSAKCDGRAATGSAPRPSPSVGWSGILRRHAQALNPLRARGRRLPATDVWWGPPRCQATLTW